jgi:hypothetical protein
MQSNRNLQFKPPPKRKKNKTKQKEETREEHYNFIRRWPHYIKKKKKEEKKEMDPFHKKMEMGSQVALYKHVNKRVSFPTSLIKSHFCPDLSIWMERTYHLFSRFIYL